MGGFSYAPATSLSAARARALYDDDRGQAGLYLNPISRPPEAAGTMATARLHLARFHVSRPLPLVSLRFGIGATPTTADTGLDAGVYGIAANGTDLTRLCSYGGAATNQLLTANSIKALTLSSPTTLQPGVYYSAWQVLTATGSFTIGFNTLGGVHPFAGLPGTGIGVMEMGFLTIAATTLPPTIAWASVGALYLAPTIFGSES